MKRRPFRTPAPSRTDRRFRITAAFLAALLSVLLLFPLTACAPPPEPPAETTAPPVTVPPPEPELTVEGGVYHYDPPKIPTAAEGIPLSDVSEHPEWREPLLALLKTFYPYDTCIPADPDKPLSDENSEPVFGAYCVGLLDVNFDGIPEVAREQGLRGSSGAITIYLYDLFTGEEIGFVEGTGWKLAVSKTGEYRYYTTTYSRMGDAHDSEGYRLIDGTQNERGHYLSEGLFVNRDFDDNWWEHNGTVCRTDLGYTFYRDGGETVSYEAADAYFRGLESDWRLVEGAEMRYIGYHDLEGDAYDLPREVLAEMMANELMKEGQKFLAFPPETGETGETGESAS